MRLVLRDPHGLRPTEQHDSQAAVALASAMAAEGVWTAPLLLHEEWNAILDGHHRCAAALRLGLALVPCWSGTYASDDIELLSWRQEWEPCPSDIEHAALSGNLLLAKTTRHRCPVTAIGCCIPLTLLGWVAGVPLTGLATSTAAPA